MKTSSCIVALCLLSACSNESADPSNGAPTTHSETSTDSSTTIGDNGSESVEAALSYYSHVQPIMQTYCTRCHQEQGMGVGDFNDPEMVKLFADIIMARMDDGTMPPPVADPACNDYEGSERMQMTAEDKATFRAWIDAGKPLGDIEQQVEVPDIKDELDNPDLEIRIGHPYTPVFNSERDPGNEYRCFVVETGRDETFYVTGIHPIIDQPALVHHIVLFKQQKGRFGDDYNPETGIDCIDDMGGLGTGMISGWAPGMVPVEFPPDTGVEISPDEELVIQMHYYLPGPEWEGQADQSGYAFNTAEDVGTKLMMLPLGGHGFNIPADNDNYAYTDSFTLPIIAPSITLYATFPHMHVLGRGYRFWITRGNGDETCIAASEKWDFNNQLTYVFNEPVELRGGDTIHMECSWNNSRSNPNLIHDPPIDVGYGERTDEEMCFAFTLIHTPIQF